MGVNAGFNDYGWEDRKSSNKRKQNTPRVISPTIQHSRLGAFGGLGDFVSQTSALFPEIEWAVPLTQKIRKYLGRTLEPSATSISVELYDPVTAHPYTFDFDLHCYRSDGNGLVWLFYNAELMGTTTLFENLVGRDLSHSKVELQRVHRFYNVLINQNSYQHTTWPAEQLTLANSPDLEKVHPLVRRYIQQPHMLDAIVQGAISKAIVKMITTSDVHYDVIWLQDWHFAAIAGELLLPENVGLAQDLYLVQHLHNALYQGVYHRSELVRILGWPKSHYSKSLFEVHGQCNLLGGVLNAICSGALNGSAIAVSSNHAEELTTIKRGVGLCSIFRPLKETAKLSGISNPVNIPEQLMIGNASEFDQVKPELKATVQEYFGLEQRDDAFLLLWSHRFTQQKQAGPVLSALKQLLEAGYDDLQVAFFCDVEIGSSSSDMDKLKELLLRFPKNTALHDFNAQDEMAVAGGVDAALMASYFEPFGYAPVWVGMQGGMVITGANGGQVDIFPPDSTIFMDIKPDIEKPILPWTSGWQAIRNRLILSNVAYRRLIFRHNRNCVVDAIKSAREQYKNPVRRREIGMKMMNRMQELADPQRFKSEIGSQVLRRSTFHENVIRPDAAFDTVRKQNVPAGGGNGVGTEHMRAHTLRIGDSQPMSAVNSIYRIAVKWLASTSQKRCKQQ